MTDAKTTKFGKTLRIVLVAFPLSLFAMLWSQLSFQDRVVAVMQTAAAENIGLLSGGGPFGPTRVWIAKAADGVFEYRSSWPVIGVIPLDVMWLGSGKTEIDLVAECQKLGESSCQFVKTDTE